MNSEAARKITRNIDMNFERIFERIMDVQEEHDVADEDLDVWLKDTWGDDLADAFIQWREEGE